MPRDMSIFTVHHDDLAGCRLAQFHLDVLLGANGLWSVYRAHDERLGRTAAVRVLGPDAACAPALRRRVLATADALTRLNLPQLAAIWEIGSDLGFDFVASEFVTGQTLAELLCDGPIPTAEAIRIGQQVALALDAAHAYGIVHGDLHPAKIKLTPEREVKILDVGFEPVPGKSRSDVRRLRYAAPERIGGQPLDARTDVYGVGAIVYELASGRPPFLQTNPELLLDAVTHGTPLSPAVLNPLIPKALESVILKAMHKRRGERYQSGG